MPVLLDIACTFHFFNNIVDRICRCGQIEHRETVQHTLPEAVLKRVSAVILHSSEVFLSKGINHNLFYHLLVPVQTQQISISEGS